MISEDKVMNNLCDYYHHSNKLKNKIYSNRHFKYFTILLMIKCSLAELKTFPNNIYYVLLTPIF